MVTYEFRCKDCSEDFEIHCHMGTNAKRRRSVLCAGRNVQSVLTASFGSPGA